MEFKKVKIEVYIPEEYRDKLREALNDIRVLGVGNYDNVMSVTKVTGYWRPLKNANPFDGEINKLSKASEDKIEFAADIENVENAVKVIKEVHPYEEPVINIIPLINDRFNLDF